MLFTLGDTEMALGAKLGSALGGGGSKDSNFINQTGGALHFSGDSPYAGSDCHRGGNGLDKRFYINKSGRSTFVWDAVVG